MSIAVTLEDPATDATGAVLPANYADRIIDLFINFLRQVFSSNRDFKYSEDERLTNILIYDTFADNIDSIGKKPTLVTDLSPIMKTNSFIDDKAGIRHPDHLAGAELKTDLFSTALVIHCISQEHDESRSLSFMVGSIIFGLRDVLRARGIHELTVETVVGKPVKLITSNRGELWSTPSTIKIAFQDNWSETVIGSELLGQIVISITEADQGGPTGCV